MLKHLQAVWSGYAPFTLNDPLGDCEITAEYTQRRGGIVRQQYDSSFTILVITLVKYWRVLDFKDLPK